MIHRLEAECEACAGMHRAHTCGYKRPTWNNNPTGGKKRKTQKVTGDGSPPLRVQRRLAKVGVVVPEEACLPWQAECDSRLATARAQRVLRAAATERHAIASSLGIDGNVTIEEKQKLLREQSRMELRRRAPPASPPPEVAPHPHQHQHQQSQLLQAVRRAPGVQRPMAIAKWTQLPSSLHLPPWRLRKGSFTTQTTSAMATAGAAVEATPSAMNISPSSTDEIATLMAPAQCPSSRKESCAPDPPLPAGTVCLAKFGVGKSVLARHRRFRYKWFEAVVLASPTPANMAYKVRYYDGVLESNVKPHHVAAASINKDNASEEGAGPAAASGLAVETDSKAPPSARLDPDCCRKVDRLEGHRSLGPQKKDAGGESKSSKSHLQPAPTSLSSPPNRSYQLCLQHAAVATIDGEQAAIDATAATIATATMSGAATHAAVRSPPLLMPKERRESSLLSPPPRSEPHLQSPPLQLSAQAHAPPTMPSPILPPGFVFLM